MKYKYRIVEETTSNGTKYFWPKRKRWFCLETINRSPEESGILMAQTMEGAMELLRQHIERGEPQYEYTQPASCRRTNYVVHKYP